MAINYNPSVVSSGLVLALDAGNIKSYDKYENLFTYSEQFDNAAWSKGSVTVGINSITAPDGTLTADKLQETNVNEQHLILQSISGVTIGSVYTLSCWAKAAERTQMSLTAFGEGYSVFNLSNGTVISTGGNSNVTITPYSNGWYKCTATITRTSTNGNFYILIWNNTNVYTGTTGSGIYIWGAQLEINSTATDYYATTTTAKTRGTTWTDLSGNGNNGTLGIGTTTPYYNNSNGGSLVFDGVNDYVTNGSTDLSIVNNLFSDSNGSWTVSAWFKFPVSPTQVRDNNLNGGNCSYSIVGRSGGIATGAAFALFVGGTTTTYGSFSNYCAVIIRGTITAVSPSTVNTNTWNNAVITWNGTNNFSYFNGSGPNAVTTGTAVAQTYNLDIGTTASLNTPSTGYHNFEGSIGSVLIHNRALTAAEIQQNYNALKGRFGLT